MNETRPKLLNAEQAGERLGVPKSWMLRMARENKIPHVPLGRYVRFDPADLDQWLAEQKDGMHTIRDRRAA